MNKLIKLFVVAMFLALMPMKSFAHLNQIAENDPTISFNITDIANFDERVFFLYNLTTDGRFDVINSEQDGVFVISANESFEGINLIETFTDFREQNAIEFARMDKVQAAETAAYCKEALSNEFISSLMIDYYIRSRQNNTCANADPFCTDNGLYQFPAGVNAGSGESGPDYDCLYTTPNPAWYYLQIDDPGNIDIYMYSTPSVDIDFCCWGPFATITNPSPCSSLTGDKVVSCSYSAQPTEHCIIPSSAQTGDYFILVITNYSNDPCNISFSKVAGTGSTNCGILPPLVDNDGPYCVGETIYLTAQGQSGASYSWTGPNNFSSNQQNPTRPNCTMAMAGTYTCTITVGSQTNSATTDVVIYPQPTANFNYTSVCKGTPTQFTSTSTTNPSGQQIQSFQWNFGDGQTGTGQNVTHTYAQAGNYSVTLTTSCGNGTCTSQKTQSVPVYAAPIASATAQPNTVIYGATSTLSASAGTTGSFNFHWEPANMVVNPNNQTTQTVPLQATQTFTVTVTNPQGGCSSTAQVTVSMEGSNMTALASADDYELCEGESTTLHASPSGGTGTYTYSWTPANTLNNATSQNPVATPPVGTTTYTCTVSDGITSQNVTVTIRVWPNTESHPSATICPDEFYDFFGEQLNQPGSYEHTTQNSHGCDSTVYLTLENYETYETPITRYVCQQEYYDFFGTQVTEPDTYYHTLESVHGCDSVIILTLLNYNRYEYDITDDFCEGSSYYFDGQYLTAPGNYTYNGQTVNGCDSIVHLTLNLSDYNTKTYNVQTCGGDYTWPSNGMYFWETGDYHVVDTVSGPYCDSIVTLNLSINAVYPDEYFEATNCDEYTWPNYGGLFYTENGQQSNQGKTYTESGYYTRYYETSRGCDSIVTLNLTINDFQTSEFTVDDNNNCDSYYWDPMGHEILYTDHDDLEYDMSGTYHRTYSDINGCDSLVTMNVQFEYTPHPTEIYPMDAQNTAPHWVVTATEFQINAYDFNLWDTNPNCHWDSVTWTCDEAPTWVLEPFGDRNQCCKVYVLNQVEDTVWLKAHAFNRCAPEEGIEQKYWLVCSFYGVDENGSTTGSANFDFDVVPNPNNGQMTLSFDHISGKANVRVYDMRGTLIDKFQTYSNNGPSSFDYNMKGKADGIYFFVVTAKEGTVARKVVIQH